MANKQFVRGQEPHLGHQSSRIRTKHPLGIVGKVVHLLRDRVIVEGLLHPSTIQEQETIMKEGCLLETKDGFLNLINFLVTTTSNKQIRTY